MSRGHHRKIHYKSRWRFSLTRETSSRNSNSRKIRYTKCWTKQDLLTIHKSRKKWINWRPRVKKIVSSFKVCSQRLETRRGSKSYKKILIKLNLLKDSKLVLLNHNLRWNLTLNPNETLSSMKRMSSQRSTTKIAGSLHLMTANLPSRLPSSPIQSSKTSRAE